MQLISTPAKLTARAAQRLQAYIHAVELALRELDRIGSVLKVVYTARVHCNSHIWVLSPISRRCNARALAW